ncbi:hypothetical protein AcW1_008700 [Taiwanofungus camphoratus]|nr:hypothetical protein AcW1_008700 [Antrodia cinnamomea]
MSCGKFWMIYIRSSHCSNLLERRRRPKGILPHDASPSTQEWTRFQQYVRHVRMITNAGKKWIAPTVFQHLAGLAGRESLLPMLTELHWSQTPFKTPAPFWDIKIFAQAPLLQTLQICNECCPSSLASIAILKDLRTVHISECDLAVDDDLLRHLAVLDNLCDLSREVGYTVNGFSTLIGFRVLENLELYGELSSIMSLVTAISPPHLRSLWIAAGTWIGLDELRPTIDMVSSKFAMMLRTIKLSTSSPLLGEPIIAQENFLDLIHPFMSLHDLEEICCYFYFTWTEMRLPDQDIYDMACAWPKLTKLSLKSYQFSDDAGPFIGSLVHFARLCPNLCSLILPRVVMPPHAHLEIYPVLPHGLRHLEFSPGAFKISDIARLAPFIDRLSPSIDTTRKSSPVDHPDDA